MTAEQVLEKIKNERGEDSLRDGQSLLGLFADYAKGQLKPQQNQLRVFLECQGNTRILNLRNAPKQKQQIEWNRLIQEMVNDYGMQKEVAMEISGAFWQVAIGTEPPVSKSAPERKPVLASSPIAEAAAETARGYFGQTGSIAEEPKLVQNPAVQDFAHDSNRKQKMQEPVAPMFKKATIQKKSDRSTLSRWCARIGIAWIIVFFLTVISFVFIMKDPDAGVEMFLFPCFVLAEFYITFFGPDKIKERVSPYIIPILEAVLFPFVLPVVLSKVYSIDADFAGFVTIMVILWAIMTILLQILLIKEEASQKSH